MSDAFYPTCWLKSITRGRKQNIEELPGSCEFTQLLTADQAGKDHSHVAKGHPKGQFRFLYQPFFPTLHIRPSKGVITAFKKGTIVLCNARSRGAAIYDEGGWSLVKENPRCCDEYERLGASNGLSLDIKCPGSLFLCLPPYKTD